MAKIKAKYGTDISSGDPSPVLEIDDIDLVELGGIVGWRFEARAGEQSSCEIEFDFISHDIEFDGVVFCDGVRMPMSASNAVLERILDVLEQRLRAKANACGRRGGKGIHVEALKLLRNEAKALFADIAIGVTI